MGDNLAHPPVQNGQISTSVRLACVLRYFSRASQYDLIIKYGVYSTEVMRSVWYIVDVINRHNDFNIKYPLNTDTQKSIATRFESASSVVQDVLLASLFGYKRLLMKWQRKPMLEGKNFLLIKKIWVELPSSL